jgi:formate C-acetyltransferase
VYDFISDLQVGIANLGDSLAAIKKCVYEDKSVSREALWNALETDFAGEEGERIRQLLLSPRLSTATTTTTWIRWSWRATTATLTRSQSIKHPLRARAHRRAYYAGTSSISANVPQGALTGATPDGRRKGEPLAEAAPQPTART